MTVQRGLIKSVSTTDLGTSVTSDAVAGATVLAVEWTAEFDPTGGLLLLGDAVLPYTSAAEADDELSTITLTDPLAADVATGEAVTSLTVAGEPRKKVDVYVAFDEGEEPVPFAVDSPLQGRITEDTPAGTPVVVDLAAGRIVGRDEVPAMLDGAQVWNPYLSRRMTVATIPDSVYVTPSAWADEVSQALTVTDTTVTTQIRGFYEIKAQVAYAANGSGRRYVRILVDGVPQGNASVAADAGAITYVACFATVLLEEGAVIEVQTYQTSGAGLALAGPNQCPVAIYRVSV